MELQVRHDSQGSRFHIPPEAIDSAPDHKMANMGTVLSYHQVSPTVLEFKSTLVPPHLRGQGVGTALVRQSLDWAREHGYHVIPTCPFVRHFIDENPSYQEMVAERA
jgi:predicted GNAT family acetyltransferase